MLDEIRGQAKTSRSLVKRRSPSTVRAPSVRCESERSQSRYRLRAAESVVPVMRAGPRASLLNAIALRGLPSRLLVPLSIGIPLLCTGRRNEMPTISYKEKAAAISPSLLSVFLSAATKHASISVSPPTLLPGQGFEVTWKFQWLTAKQEFPQYP